MFSLCEILCNFFFQKNNGGLIMVNFDDENIAYEEEFTLDHVIGNV